MTHYPFFSCKNEKESASACFRIYLACHGYQVDFKELNYVFNPQNLGVSLSQFFKGLDYYQIAYQEVLTDEIIRKHLSCIIVKQHHHYQILFKYFAGFWLTADPMSGWHLYSERQLANMNLEACIQLKFPGNYPYVSKKNASLLPFCLQLLCLFPSLLSMYLPNSLIAYFLGMALLLVMFFFLCSIFYPVRQRKFAGNMTNEAVKKQWQDQMIWTEKRNLVIFFLLYQHSYVLRYFSRYWLIYFPYIFVTDILLLILNHQEQQINSDFFLKTIKMFLKKAGFGVFYLSLAAGVCLLKDSKGLTLNFLVGLLICLLHPLLFILLIYYQKKLRSLDTDLFDQWLKVDTSLKRPFEKIESIGVGKYYFDKSTLVTGSKKELHRFFMLLHSPELILNGVLSAKYGFLDHLDHLAYYQNLLYLDQSQTVMQIFKNHLDLLLEILDDLNLFRYCFCLEHMIGELDLQAQEIFGFAALFFDASDFTVIESAFLYQDEQTMIKCLQLIEKQNAKSKFILAIPTIKLMNQEAICAIIEHEKVG